MTQPEPTATVRLERRIAAPPEQVYAAWTDPEVIRRWFGPDDFRVADVQVDARIGGRLRIWHERGGEEVGGSDSEYVELVPGQRVVLRWSFVGPDREIDASAVSLLTVTLVPVDDGSGTDLVLEHSRLEGLRAADPSVADGVTPGWASALARLSTTFEGARR